MLVVLIVVIIIGKPPRVEDDPDTGDCEVENPRWYYFSGGYFGTFLLILFSFSWCQGNAFVEKKHSSNLRMRTSDSHDLSQSELSSPKVSKQSSILRSRRNSKKNSGIGKQPLPLPGHGRSGSGSGSNGVESSTDTSCHSPPAVPTAVAGLEIAVVSNSGGGGNGGDTAIDDDNNNNDNINNDNNNDNDKNNNNNNDNNNNNGDNGSNGDNESVGEAYGNENVRCWGRWWRTTFHFKHCYFVTLFHLIDVSTDIAVIVEFIQLYRLERKYNNKRTPDYEYCDGVNTWILGRLCLGTLVLYRIFSAFGIWRVTGGKIRGFAQLFDLEIFRAMKVNYDNNSQSPSSPQRWIESMESFWSSTFMALFQLYFIYKSRVYSREINFIVYFSAFWSMVMIAKRAVYEDRPIFKDEYQYANVYLDCTNCKKCRTRGCINWGFLDRLFYRLNDVFYRYCVVLLVWVFIGGPAIFLLLSIELVLILIAVCKTRELGVFFQTLVCYSVNVHACVVFLLFFLFVFVVTW